MLISEREQRVISGIEQGLTAKQIASMINLSEPTVRNTLTALYDRFDITGNKKEARLISLCYQNDILKTKREAV